MKIEIKGKVIYEWPQKGNTVQVITTNKVGTVIRRAKSGQFLVRLEPDYKVAAFYEDELQLPQLTQAVRDILQVMTIEQEIGRSISRRELDQNSFTARGLNGVEHTYVIGVVPFPWGVMPTVAVQSIMSLRNNPGVVWKSQSHRRQHQVEFAHDKFRQQFDEMLFDDGQKMDESGLDSVDEDEEI
jgi:hypothetical protein